MTPSLPFDRPQLVAPLRRAVMAFVVFAMIDWRRRAPDVFDASLTARLAARPSTVPFRLADAASSVSSVIVVLLLTIVVASYILRHGGDRIAIVAVLLATSIGALGDQLVEVIVGRRLPRTGGSTGDTNVLLRFGHTTGFAAVTVATFLALDQTSRRRTATRRWAAAAAFCSCAVAFTRVMVGAQYVFDAIGGLSLGIAIGLASHLVPSSAFFAHRGHLNNSTPARNLTGQAGEPTQTLRSNSHGDFCKDN